jgi:hypothetical protein
MMQLLKMVFMCMVFSCAVTAICGLLHAAEPGVAPPTFQRVELDAPLVLAGVKVSAEHSVHGTAFQFETVPVPASNDAATKAEFTLVDGERDRNGGQLGVLHDGRVPTDEDQPSANFFFRAGSDGGRLRLDLGKVIAVKRVSTYSWHPNTRAPQVYRLYASDGTASGFHAVPGRGTDPESCGWKHVASVDTRSQSGDWGGQHGVTITDPGAGVLGEYRYFLFDISRTQARDAFGNTFYSEIDVIDAEGPAPMPATTGAGERMVKSFATDCGSFRFALDATAAPDLMEWADTELAPVVQQWYPKIVEMLPSEGFVAPPQFTLYFRNDMGGTPASAGGGRINLNSNWFRRERNREARGCVVHELVHVVQAYGRASRTNPGAVRTPGWLVEGIADYIRWFLYEPETNGAEITERNLPIARYDASYRISANFLNWVVSHHDREIIRKLNAVAREGKYAQELWKEWTGKTLQELGDDWKNQHEARLTRPVLSD